MPEQILTLRGYLELARQSPAAVASVRRVRLDGREVRHVLRHLVGVDMSNGRRGELVAGAQALARDQTVTLRGNIAAELDIQWREDSPEAMAAAAAIPLIPTIGVAAGLFMVGYTIGKWLGGGDDNGGTVVIQQTGNGNITVERGEDPPTP